MANPRTLYQIFVSSTYLDLRDERLAVTWAVLKTRNTPAGMEAFPATDDRGWKTIQRTIDDSDFYVLLLGFRYGSIDPESGLSWTHKEYQYAKSKGIPILVFLRDLNSTPGDQVEGDAKLRKKIEAFRTEVSKAHKYSAWRTADGLAGLVGDAINIAIQDNSDASNPRPGWIRGSNNAANVAGEMAVLLEENRRLRNQLAERDKLERAPLVTFEPAQMASSISSDAFVRRVYIQNICAHGIMIELDAVKWLWQAPGALIQCPEPLPRRERILTPGAKSLLSLFIKKSDILSIDRTNADSRQYDAIRVTVILTLTSKPYGITLTRSFALAGAILEPPEEVPSPLQPPGALPES